MVRRNLTILALVSVAVLVLDQWTKALVRSRFEVGESLTLIEGVFDLARVENRGAAFGMFQGATWFFVAMAAVFVLAAVAFLFIDRKAGVFEVLSVSLVASGAVGNMVDRIAHVTVTDFIHARFIDFPVFNVADIAISVGSVLLVLWVAVSGRDDGAEDDSEKVDCVG